MLSDAVKKHRDLLAFGLLAVATLYLISGLSLLFKSEDDTFLDFSGRAATIGYLFTNPFVIIALAGAVALAAGFGQSSANARPIVFSALVIGAICLILGLVCWLAGFGYDGNGFGGVFMAGKIVAVLLGLAQLLGLSLVLFFAVVALQALPKPVRQTQQQWGGYGQHAQQQWGQPGQQQWGQQPPQQWGQPAQPGQPGGQQWGPPPQQWASPEQQQGWGQPEQQQAWGQHVEQQQWAQPEQQQATWGGEHAQQAQAWSAPEAPQTDVQQPDTQQPEVQQSWGQPEQEQSWAQPGQQQSWGQPAEHEAQTWAPSEAADASAPVAESAEDGSPSEPAEQTESATDGDDETAEGQQDGWWQRPSQ